MDFVLNFRELLLLIGLLLSTIIAIAFGIKTDKRSANIWFSGFLGACAIVFLVKLLYSTGQIVNYPHWFKINYPAGILRPVFFYLYISYLLNSTSKFKLNHLLHFVPFLLLTAFLIPFFLMDGDYKKDVLYGRVTNELGLIPDWYVIFQYLYSVVYFVLVYFSLRSFVKRNPRPNTYKKTLVKWIRLILIASVAFISAALLIRITGLDGAFNIYSYDLFSMLLILLCIRLITLPEIVGTNKNADSKYINSSLSEKEIVSWFAQINALMSEKHYYKSKDLIISDLAQILELPVYQVSQIINESTGKSFTSFVNSFRVEEAKRILLKDHSKYTIEGIGQEAGFKSRATFYTAFKKHTGLTPSQFLK